MFHYNRGLVLDKAQLAVDCPRRQPRAFVSHAHQDHMARHMFALATPATCRLYEHRMGMRPTLEMPFRLPVQFGGLRLTTYPAGHCLGSAMLLAEDGDTSLLYTGDFKLSPSATAQRAELPHADILVMESTFGRPEYRFPPRETLVEQLLNLVTDALAAGQTPVLHAYLLGKGQEATKILTDAGIPVLQHPSMYEITRVYQACGVEMGNCRPYGKFPEEGHAVVTVPHWHKKWRLPGLSNIVSITLTGWGQTARGKARCRGDHVIPLSDHADYDELFDAVERVEPHKIYCTHGDEKFVYRLREAGWNAFPLRGSFQKTLF